MKDLSQYRVLIVDNVKSDIDALVNSLADHFKISTARNGEKAIKHVHANPPDLILLNIKMPGMNGYKVCQQLKKDSSTSNIPIIFVTAVDDIEDKSYGFELGAVDFISKPFHILEAKARIQTHLQLKHANTELDNTIELQNRNISDLASIGKAMSTEHNLSRVLELILRLARRVTKADAGTLYLLTDDNRELAFHVLHNDTLSSYMGGTSNNEVTLPNVNLYSNEAPNHANVSAFVALTNQTVNIPDVYEADGFNFEGAKVFDNMTKYRSQSMLVIPMCDHEGHIIGVLQLINSKNDDNETVPFNEDVVELSESLASQAAVMLTQKNLIDTLKNLFESFIKAIATAIEEKSKYTGGHIERVAELTLKIAEEINRNKNGRFADIYFSPEEMDELRIAAWMHDTGKVTTSQHIVDKSMKLEGIFDKIELVNTRWQAITLSKQLEAEQAKVKLKGGANKSKAIQQINAKLDTELATLNDEFKFIKEINEGGEFMSEAKIERLKDIAQKSYQINDEVFQYLSDDEVENLSILKGTLTHGEREVVENHAHMTKKILQSLPWPRNLSNVAEIAGAHHEKMNGTGYPEGLEGNKISLQSRIMAVSDIFEALSAPDRPYKKPMTVSQAVKILGFMVKDNHLDNDIVEILLNSKLIEEYSSKYLSKSQYDLQ